MQRTAFTASLKHWPRTTFLVLLAALLWAQMLGQVHGVLHARLLPSAPSTSVSAHAASAPQTDVLGHLLAPADDESKCRLYDQLAHVSPATHEPSLAQPPAVWWPIWVAQTSLLSTYCAAFAARAPPISL